MADFKRENNNSPFTNEFRGMIAQLIREVVVERPFDTLLFCSEYFQRLLQERDSKINPERGIESGKGEPDSVREALNQEIYVGNDKTQMQYLKDHANEPILTAQTQCSENYALREVDRLDTRDDLHNDNAPKSEVENQKDVQLLPVINKTDLEVSEKCEPDSFEALENPDDEYNPKNDLLANGDTYFDNAPSAPLLLDTNDEVENNEDPTNLRTQFPRFRRKWSLVSKEICLDVKPESPEPDQDSDQLLEEDVCEVKTNAPYTPCKFVPQLDAIPEIRAFDAPNQSNLSNAQNGTMEEHWKFSNFKVDDIKIENAVTNLTEILHNIAEDFVVAKDNINFELENANKISDLINYAQSKEGPDDEPDDYEQENSHPRAPKSESFIEDEKETDVISTNKTDVFDENEYTRIVQCNNMDHFDRQEYMNKNLQLYAGLVNNFKCDRKPSSSVDAGIVNPAFEPHNVGISFKKDRGSYGGARGSQYSGFFIDKDLSCIEESDVPESSDKENEDSYKREGNTIDMQTFINKSNIEQIQTNNTMDSETMSDSGNHIEINANSSFPFHSGAHNYLHNSPEYGDSREHSPTLLDYMKIMGLPESNEYEDKECREGIFEESRIYSDEYFNYQSDEVDVLHPNSEGSPESSFEVVNQVDMEIEKIKCRPLYFGQETGIDLRKNLHNAGSGVELLDEIQSHEDLEPCTNNASSPYSCKRNDDDQYTMWEIFQFSEDSGINLNVEIPNEFEGCSNPGSDHENENNVLVQDVDKRQGGVIYEHPENLPESNLKNRHNCDNLQQTEFIETTQGNVDENPQNISNGSIMSDVDKSSDVSNDHDLDI